MIKDTQTTTLTSVRVIKEKYSNFKIQCIRDNFNFTELVDKCMDLYLLDEDFRKSIIKYQKK